MPKKKLDATRPDLKLGWHFLPADRLLEYSDGRKAEVGKTLSMTNGSLSGPSVCHRGMHASPKITQAASYQKGPTLCRVEVWGDVDDGGNKFAGRHRKVLWMKTLTVQDFAALFAAIGYKPDQASYIKTIDGCVAELANNTDESGVEEWLENWAAQNGCPGAKTHEIQFVYRKPKIEAEHLKALLNDRMVMTTKELTAIVKDGFDVSNIDDAFYDLACETGVCSVDGYDDNSDDGYVLVRKAPKRKRK